MLLCPLFPSTYMLLQADLKDEGSVLHCLLEYKMSNAKMMETDPRMTKCNTVLEHWQILTMTDWRFSPRFKRVCQKDVKNLCSP